jgi:prepilin peptidase CpaA
MSAIGGGDVKLLTAIGALAGLQAGIEAELCSFIVAAVVVPGKLAWEGKLMPVLGNTVALVANPFLPEKRRRPLCTEMLTTIRFGPAIFAGTAIATLLQWRLQ